MCFGYVQLLDYRSYTYTYLLADPVSRSAVIIDPVIDMVDRDVALVRDLGLDLKFGGKPRKGTVCHLICNS